MNSETAWPFGVVTVTFPEVAPAGIVTVICELPALTEKPEATILRQNLTVIPARFELSKPAP